MNLIEQNTELKQALESLLKLKITRSKAKHNAIMLLEKLKKYPTPDYYDRIHLQVVNDIELMKKNGDINITKEDVAGIIKNAISKYS